MLRPPSLCSRPSPAGRRLPCRGCNCSRANHDSSTSTPLPNAIQSSAAAAAAAAPGARSSAMAAHAAITATAAAAAAVAFGMAAPAAARAAAAATADALAATASTIADAAADGAATATTVPYVPSPLQVPEWQIWVGSVAGAFPFVIGAYEFGKRILIQQRCRVCAGSGLVERGPTRLQRKCPECGGFFPWRGWGEFLSATAQPGNGGPLLAPRGQTSVFYKVPPPLPPTSASSMSSTPPTPTPLPASSPPSLSPPSADLKAAVDAAIAARPGQTAQQQQPEEKQDSQ